MRTALITSFILGLVESKSWSALDSSAPGPAHSPDLAPLAVQYQRRDDSTNHQNDPTLASFQREPPLEGTPQTPNARYRRTRYGPITLQPKSHADELIGNVPKPCTECWITAFQTQVVFKDNRVAQGSDGVELRVSAVRRVWAEWADCGVCSIWCCIMFIRYVEVLDGVRSGC